MKWAVEIAALYPDRTYRLFGFNDIEAPDEEEATAEATRLTLEVPDPHGLLVTTTLYSIGLEEEEVETPPPLYTPETAIKIVKAYAEGTDDPLVQRMAADMAAAFWNDDDDLRDLFILGAEAFVAKAIAMRRVYWFTRDMGWFVENFQGETFTKTDPAVWEWLGIPTTKKEWYFVKDEAAAARLVVIDEWLTLREVKA